LIQDSHGEPAAPPPPPEKSVSPPAYPKRPEPPEAPEAQSQESAKSEHSKGSPVSPAAPSARPTPDDLAAESEMNEEPDDTNSEMSEQDTEEEKPSSEKSSSSTEEGSSKSTIKINPPAYPVTKDQIHSASPSKDDQKEPTSTTALSPGIYEHPEGNTLAYFPTMEAKRFP
ncbi:hypothetical protein COOONC_25426, partial [Cooperia oncophora]